jgi:hypothetical protein
LQLILDFLKKNKKDPVWSFLETPHYLYAGHTMTFKIPTAPTEKVAALVM